MNNPQNLENLHEENVPATADSTATTAANPFPSRSRRQMVKAGAGLLLAAATGAVVGDPDPARAAGLTGPTGTADSAPPVPLRNPSDIYPKPPFQPQQQPFPGLVSKMIPRPDHGEKSYKGTGKLTGRRALVTGGDSGIGRAAAIAFAREGASVAINYLPVEQSDAQEVIDLLQGEGRKIVAIPGDIRDESFCNQLVDKAVEGLGGLDLLVNVAGRQHAVSDIADLSSQQMDDTFKTNIYAMFWITRAAVKHLEPGATIINTTSIQAFDPSPFLLDYACTKAAIANFTESLAKQLAPKGIRVNAVAPGPIWTPLQPSGGQLPEKLPEFGKETPIGRPGQPAELGPTYVLLASADSSYTTGAIYAVTGGQLLY